MNKILVLGASLVLALAPSGTALANDDFTNNGKGNCGYDARDGGTPLDGSVAKGFGGHVVQGKPQPCTRVSISPIAGTN